MSASYSIYFLIAFQRSLAEKNSSEVMQFFDVSLHKPLGFASCAAQVYRIGKRYRTAAMFSMSKPKPRLSDQS